MRSRTQRSSWRRWLSRLLVATVAIALLAPLALLLALQSPGFRQTLLRLASRAAERRIDVALAAGDFRLRPLAAELELDELELRRPGAAAPFARVDRGRIEWSWRSLLRGRPLVRALELERPRLDLGAPLPRSGDGEADPGEATPPAFELAEVRIEGGSIRGAPVPERLEVWLDAWRLDDLELAGSFLDRETRLRVDASRLTVHSRRRPPLELAVRAELSVGAAGEVMVEELGVDGDHLELEARGTGSLALLPARISSLRLRADLGRLFPDLTPSGEVAAEGELLVDEGGAVSGSATLRARRLPGALLEPWADGAGLAQLELAATFLDVHARVALEADGPGSPKGDADLQLDWRRDGGSLVTAEAGLRSGLDGEGVGLNLEARILPARPGRRALAAELRAPAWDRLDEAAIAAARLEIEAEDLADVAARLGLDAESAELWGLAGALALTARAEGPVLAPRILARAAWEREGERILEAQVRTPRGVGLSPGSKTTVDLELALFPTAPERLDLRGTLRTADWSRLGRSELRDARLTLAPPHLAAAWKRLQSTWPLLPPLPVPAALLEASLEAELRGEGTLDDLALELQARWRAAPDESLELAASGRLDVTEPSAVGPFAATVRLSGLDLTRLAIADDLGRPLAGRLRGTVELTGTPAAPAGRLELAATGLGYEGGPGLESAEVEITSDGARLELVRLRGRLDEAAGGARFAATAALELARPIRSATASVELIAPVPELTAVAAELRLDGGTVLLDPLRLEWSDREGAPAAAVLTATLPLATLLELAGAGDALVALPLAPDAGALTLELAELELAALAALLFPQPPALQVDGALTGSLRLDGLHPQALSGALRVSDLRLTTADGRLEAVAPVRLDIGDAMVDLPPVQWRIFTGLRGEASVTDLEIGGELRLDPAWRPEAEWAEAIERLSFAASGGVDAALLNPFLGGGVAAGVLSLDAGFEGPVDRLSGRLRLRGPEVYFYWSLPYPTRLQAPEVDLALERGRLVIETARARANRGTLELGGSATSDDALDLRLTLDNVYYRLDYGLTTLLSGDLALRRAGSAGSPATLSGDLVVRRGTLRRDLELDRELLSALFGPAPLESAAPGPFDELRLDLAISTLEGLSVRNNLADLKVDWNPLQVRGTVGQPLVSGRFDLDPGGRITAYGQTVRIDEGTLILSGDPDIEPRMILETTSSLDDPTLRRDKRWYSDAGWGDRGSWETGFFGPGESPDTAALTSGVAAHYTERLAAAMGGTFAGTEVSYQALPVFGETDTQARWTLSQRLSPRVTFINSRNPRDAQGTTNLVDLHGVPEAPGVVAQLFNDDQGDYGVTLQQTRQLGGARGEDATLLRRISITAPPRLSARSLRRATGFRKGDPFPEGSDFDVEVDVGEELRRRGYPGSQVRAAVAEAGRGFVDLRISVDPGPRVRFAFEGDMPPRATRREIASLYLPQRLAEPASLAEVRRETVAALRSLGFLEPEIEIAVEPDDAAAPQGDRTVTVRSRGGRRIEPGPPQFQGLDAEAVTALGALFDDRLSRVELAAATPGADALLRQALRRLGYPRARVVSRELSADGSALTVHVDPGPRRMIGAVAISGVGDEEEAARLETLLPLRTGEPLRAEGIARAAAAIERDLRRRGHADVRVEADVDELGGDGEIQAELRLLVRPGPSYRIDGVRLEGLEATREGWAGKVAGLEPQTLLTSEKVGEARRRLYRTGLFSRIDTETERLGPTAAPGAAADAAIAGAVVAFDLEERPRFSFSYGGRYESSEGLGGAVYLSDGNFLGRGRTLGLRATYMGENDRSVGVYHAWPRVGGTRSLLEFFVEALTEVDRRIVVEGVEGWTQLTIPLSPRRQTRFYALFQNRAFAAEAPTADALEDEDAANLFLGWQYLFDNRDRALGRKAPKGLFVGLDLSGSAAALGSDFGELRLFAQGKLYHPVGPEPFHARTEAPMTWGQSVRIGWLEPFEGVIPRVDRLTAGGEFSVRGYPTDSLGPLDGDGVPLGGEVFFIVNQELHLPLWRNFGAVVFFDAGNVWASSADVDGDLFTAAGLGLRSASPIGPLRLDVAFPLDRRPGIDSDYEIYLGFGPTF